MRGGVRERSSPGVRREFGELTQEIGMEFGGDRAGRSGEIGPLKILRTATASLSCRHR